MTKREAAERIISQSGDCVGIDCGDCPCFINKICKGDSGNRAIRNAEQWLKDNPEEIPELQPVLCEVYNKKTDEPFCTKIIGKINGKYIDIALDVWNHAEPIKEKKTREMTIEEKQKWLFEKLGNNNLEISVFKHLLDTFNFPEIEE